MKHIFSMPPYSTYSNAWHRKYLPWRTYAIISDPRHCMIRQSAAAKRQTTIISSRANVLAYHSVVSNVWYRWRRRETTRHTWACRLSNSICLFPHRHVQLVQLHGIQFLFIFYVKVCWGLRLYFSAKHSATASIAAIDCGDGHGVRQRFEHQRWYRYWRTYISATVRHDIYDVDMCG